MALFQGYVALPTAYITKADTVKSGQFSVPDRYGRSPTFDLNAPKQSWNDKAPSMAAQSTSNDLLKNPVEWFASRGANITALQRQREQQMDRDKMSDKDFTHAALTRRRFNPVMARNSLH